MLAGKIEYTVVLAVLAVLVQASSTVRNALRCTGIIADTFPLSRIIITGPVATGSQADNRGASILALGRDII